MPRTRQAKEREEPFELRLTDIYLVTRDAQGDLAVPHIGVVFNPSGMTVTKPDGSVAAEFSWSNLKELRTAELVETQVGEPAVVVEVVSNLSTHRFVVPTDDPHGLEAVVAEVSRSLIA